MACIWTAVGLTFNCWIPDVFTYVHHELYNFCLVRSFLIIWCLRCALLFRTYFPLLLFQVPRSSKKLHEDNEYALFTVTLFNRVADNFKTSAREKGFQVSLFFFFTLLSWVAVSEYSWSLYLSK